jgi:hypothetical protein
VGKLNYWHLCTCHMTCTRPSRAGHNILINNALFQNMTLWAAAGILRGANRFGVPVHYFNYLICDAHVAVIRSEPTRAMNLVTFQTRVLHLLVLRCRFSTGEHEVWVYNRIVNTFRVMCARIMIRHFSAVGTRSVFLCSVGSEQLSSSYSKSHV